MFSTTLEELWKKSKSMNHPRGPARWRAQFHPDTCETDGDASPQTETLFYNIEALFIDTSESTWVYTVGLGGDKHYMQLHVYIQLY